MPSFFKRFSFIFFTLLTIGINILAALLPLNGQTTGSISDRYFTPLTPAGFAFSIWSLIYIGLTVIGLMIVIGRYTLSNKGQFYYILSSLCNCVWIFFWHYLQVNVAALFLALIVVFNLLTYFEINSDTKESLRPVVRNWFLIYVGWVFVAVIINITILLRNFGFDGFGLSPEIWAVIMIGAAALINFLFSWRERTSTTALVFTWALFGIYNSQSSELIKNTSLIVITLLLLFSVTLIAASFRTHRKIPVTRG
jgi:translocator protein